MYSGIYLAFAVAAILHGKTLSQISDEYTDYCIKHPNTELACYDESHLIACMKIGASVEPIGSSLLSCSDPLCCNSKLIGCSLACSEDVTTPSPATCKNGDLKPYETCGKYYYYCRQNTWIPAECAIGNYDEIEKACTFGQKC